MKTNKKRILIFGAGVIGSTIGGRIALSGHDVTFYARNNRLKELELNGLWLQKNGQKNPQNVRVNIISELTENDIYDFIFVTIRKENLRDALPILSLNKSNNFVFMVNNSSGYSELISALGANRVIPAFPGCGGKIEDGIVHYEIVSRFIQPTTLGEISGLKTHRIRTLKSIISKAGFPTSFSANMDVWQKSHIAMVAPLGDVIYYDGGNNYTVAKNREAIKLMNQALRENFVFLNKSGIGIEPFKLNIFRITPLWMMNLLMRFGFNTKWAEMVISNHANNAKQEMSLISLEFIELAEKRGFKLKAFLELINKNE